MAIREKVLKSRVLNAIEIIDLVVTNTGSRRYFFHEGEGGVGYEAEVASRRTM